MSSLCGPVMVGNFGFRAATMWRVSSTDSVVCVTQARLSGFSGSSAAICSRSSTRVIEPLGSWPMVPTTSGMAGMADQQHVAAALVVDLGLAVDLGHQRAGGVDGEQAAVVGVGRHGLGDAVGGEDHRRLAVGDLVEFVDEDRAFAFRLSTTYLLCTISWRT